VIWAVLAAIGVPLWLCAIGIGMLLFNNRRLRKRYGDVPVRVRRPGKKRWTRGHGIWVSDVFAWRGSPAAWSEELLWVRDATARAADPEERKKLHRLGDEPAIATFVAADGETVEVAAAPEQASALLGPFAHPTETDPNGRSVRPSGATASKGGTVAR
jgi:hypothetical protein